MTSDSTNVFLPYICLIISWKQHRYLSTKTRFSDYSSLYNLLPDPAPQSFTPPLSDVFEKVMGMVDAYQQGTLIIMPVRNGLFEEEEDLTKEIGVSNQRMKTPENNCNHY